MCLNNIKYKFNPGVQHFIWIITVGVEYAPGYSVIADLKVSGKSIGVNFFQGVKRNPDVFATFSACDVRMAGVSLEAL